MRSEEGCKQPAARTNGTRMVFVKTWDENSVASSSLLPPLLLKKVKTETTVS
jgi:hypothetical protein